jgi:hypothetical protein
MSPTCLGWCVRTKTEGKPRFFDRSFDKERPARVYDDPAWWCCSCGKRDE